MKVIKVENYEALSSVAADIIIEEVKNNPKANLGLATGGSPVGLYNNLVADYDANKTSYADISAFNLDEYIGLPQDHPQTYHTFMNENLFKHINIKPEHTHIPDGSVSDVLAESKRYNDLLKDHPIDLQLLGIGTNGHIGFNEPGSSFTGEVAVADLTEETIEANARYFEGDEDLVPTKAISMGIGNIMQAKKVLLIASGANKAEAIKWLVEGEVSEELPASILQKHPNVVIVVDEAAASLLSK